MAFSRARTRPENILVVDGNHSLSVFTASLHNSMPTKPEKGRPALKPRYTNLSHYWGGDILQDPPRSQIMPTSNWLKAITEGDIRVVDNPKETVEFYRSLRKKAARETDPRALNDGKDEYTRKTPQRALFKYGEERGKEMARMLNVPAPKLPYECFQLLAVDADRQRRVDEKLFGRGAVNGNVKLNFRDDDVDGDVASTEVDSRLDSRLSRRFSDLASPKSASLGEMSFRMSKSVDENEPLDAFYTVDRDTMLEESGRKRMFISPPPQLAMTPAKYRAEIKRRVEAKRAASSPLARLSQPSISRQSMEGVTENRRGSVRPPTAPSGGNKMRVARLSNESDSQQSEVVGLPTKGGKNVSYKRPVTATRQASSFRHSRRSGSVGSIEPERVARTSGGGRRRSVMAMPTADIQVAYERYLVHAAVGGNEQIAQNADRTRLSAAKRRDMKMQELRNAHMDSWGEYQ